VCVGGGEGRGDKGGSLPARGQPGYCGESILSNYTGTILPPHLANSLYRLSITNI
jgi:hypothetical protein